MRYLFIIFVIAVSIKIEAQPVKDVIHKGNEYYRQSDFDLAENQYRRALQQAPQNTTAQFNLANSLYRQKKYDEANSVLDKLATSSAGTLKSSAYYNTGVIFSKEKDLPASIEAYKNALRYNPNDVQARENLQKALGELRNQQQNQQKTQKQQSNMSQKEAEQKLKQLEEKEKQLQQRLQGQNSKRNNSMEQDW